MMASPHAENSAIMPQNESLLCSRPPFRLFRSSDLVISTGASTSTSTSRGRPYCHLRTHIRTLAMRTKTKARVLELMDHGSKDALSKDDRGRIKLSSWSRTNVLEPIMDADSMVQDFREDREDIWLCFATENEKVEAEQTDASHWEMLNVEEALVCMEQMDDLPSLSDYVCILQKCRKKRVLKNARRLHAHILMNGMEAHKLLGNYLVPMLVECGSMSDAQQVFNRLVYQNEHSWTSLIQGYIDNGEPQLALHVFEKMQDNGVPPSRHTFVAVVKACARLKKIARGYELHVEITKQHVESDLFIGNTLVDLYVKCGLLAEAKKVFDQMQVRDVVSWTAMLAGYAEHGLGQEALSCLKQMKEEGITLNAVTYICSLKACGSIGAIAQGLELHCEVVRDGLEEDGFLGNSLVDMYAKCGSLAESQAVFDELPTRDIVSWNALVTGYAEHGHAKEALFYLGKMKQEGVPPNAVTFLCGLKASGSLRDLVRGRQIHEEADREGYGGDPLIVNALVDVYARCGSLAEAHQVFDKLLVRDVLTWTALIAGYAEEGLADEALNCLKQMQLEGVTPDTVAFMWSLKACGISGALSRGREVHKLIEEEGHANNVMVRNSLVDMYAKCGSFKEAWEVFDSMPVRTVVTWTALISAYAEHGLGEEALKCLDQMQREGVSPNAVTHVCSLKACGIIKAIYKGRNVHSEIVEDGLEGSDFLGNSLVDMYAKCCSFPDAHDVFNELLVRDVVSWTALISGYAEPGYGEEAFKHFELMQLEGISAEDITWNSVIMGYAEQGEAEKAFELYDQMKEQGLLPNRVSFLSILKACSKAAKLEIGKRVHSQVLKDVGNERTLANSLVDMYGKCGKMVEARELFDSILSRDCVSYSALMAGYVHKKKYKVVLDLFEKMKSEGIQPDGIVFLIVLTACRCKGFARRGRQYFDFMTKDCGITPTIEHQNCMFDLLGQSGYIDEAVAMIL